MAENEYSKMDLLRKFAGGIAHDFNNLLTGIMGFAMLLREDTEEGSELAHYAGEIEKSSQRCRELTDKLISFGRKNKPEMQETDIGSAVKAGIEKAVAGMGLEPDIKADLCGDPVIKADRELIERAVYYIMAGVGNDGKGFDRVSFSVEKTPADESHPSLVAGREHLRIKISIHRVTAAETDPAQAFEPIYKTARQELFGYELAVAREIFEAHGGSLSAVKEGKEGIVFEAMLPSR
jgi:two-component system cell cycle sensor histidine kinase/response regulator CckA